MKKIVNGFFSFFKYVLLLIAFGLTLFIMLRMYARLGRNITEAFGIFLPYIILLILFVLNVVLKRKYVRNNLFYNITASFVFISNILVCVRSIVDKNMLFNVIQKMGVNFNFYNDYIAFNRILIYGLVLANIIFMLVPNGDKKEETMVKKVIVKDKEEKKKSEPFKKIEIDEEII